MESDYIETDVEMGLKSQNIEQYVALNTCDEESETVVNTITPKSSEPGGLFFTTINSETKRELLVGSCKLPSSPTKAQRQVSNPVTTKEKLKVVNSTSQLEVNETKSINFLFLLSQDASKKLKLQRRTGGYFRPILSSSTKIFYCTICMENHATSSGFSFEACTAKHQFCLPCIQMYTVVQINDGTVRHVCPFDECSAVVTEAEIRRLVDDTTFEKYERFSMMKSDPNYRECSKCFTKITIPLSIVHRTTDSNQLTCESCGHVTCFIHGDSHPEETCKQYTRRINKVERATKRIVNATTRKCPNCHVSTEKNGGCNHMVCCYSIILVYNVNYYIFICLDL